MKKSSLLVLYRSDYQLSANDAKERIVKHNRGCKSSDTTDFSDRIFADHIMRVDGVDIGAIRGSYLVDRWCVEAALYKTRLTLAAASVFLRILIVGIVETRGKSRVARQRWEVSVSAEAARVEKG